MRPAGVPMSGRVLIAEDEPSIVISLEFLMRNDDYDVRVARNGREALDLASSFLPDVLLLDVMMPEHDGFEVCRRIRSNSALQNIRIIMLTARGLDAERDAGLANGADAYVTKPFSTKELRAKVRQLMPGSP